MSLGAEKGVTSTTPTTTQMHRLTSPTLNRSADLVGDGVDVIVAVWLPHRCNHAGWGWRTDIPVAPLLPRPRRRRLWTARRTSPAPDALNTEAIIVDHAVNRTLTPSAWVAPTFPSLDASTQAIADAKAFYGRQLGIKYIEKNGTTNAEVQMAAEALIASWASRPCSTPTDNTVMTAELSIYETFIEAASSTTPVPTALH